VKFVFRSVKRKHTYKICVVYVLAVENMTMVLNFEVTYVTMNILGIATGVNYAQNRTNYFA
jgi:hypothetical protein